MRNCVSSHAVADFFLVHVDANAGDTISNLKLQKLCYYAQAWSLALNDEPLFQERIEAWTHGPAIPELYRRFKHYGSSAIDPYDLVTDPVRDLHEQHKELIAGVWERYGRFSGTQLRNLTHRERPWRDARGDTPPDAHCNVEITHEAMRSFYGQMLRSSAYDTNSGATAT